MSSEANRCVSEFWPTDHSLSKVVQSFDGGSLEGEGGKKQNGINKHAKLAPSSPM